MQDKDDVTTMKAEAPPARTTGIQSIEIGFRIVRALAEGGGALPLRLIAQAAAMSPSKARMYLVSLIRTGLVSQDDGTGLYGLGPYASELGAAAHRRTDLLAAAQAAMDALGRATGALLLLSAWGPAGATLLRQADGAEALPIDFRIGSPVSLTRTATGHVCLAFLPNAATCEHRAAELADNQLVPDLRFIDDAHLDGVAASVRAAGTAAVRDVRLASGIVLVGYTAIAAPIFDNAGTLRLVLTALHPKRRPKLTLAATRGLLREATERLSGLDVLRERRHSWQQRRT